MSNKAGKTNRQYNRVNGYPAASVRLVQKSLCRDRKDEMNRHTNNLIVGQGLAGTTLAWRFLDTGQSSTRRSRRSSDSVQGVGRTSDSMDWSKNDKE